MKGKPVGTPARQPQPAPSPQLAITKEVRHLTYHLDVVDTPSGGRALLVVLPGEAEAHVYDLTEDAKQRLVAGLTGGIQVASAGELPPDPQPE